MKTLYTILLALWAINTSISQCLQYEVPLAERIERADMILEGKVIKSEGFWNEQMTRIYTTHTILPYKLFKGKLATQQVQVVTSGGVVGFNAQIEHPGLTLEKEQTGIFFLKQSQVLKNTTTDSYEVVALNQGFISYDPYNKVAIDVFGHYYDIQLEVYQRIQQLIRQPYTNIEPFSPEKYFQRYPIQLNKAVSNWTPSSISAGTESVLTINGTGFGNTQGEVVFSNADNGGFTMDVLAIPVQIVSWSNTRIRVQVPSKAGTGPFGVVTASGNLMVSNDVLTVDYAVINIQGVFNGVSYAHRTRHINDDGNGGYTWELNEDLAQEVTNRVSESASEWCSNANVPWGFSNQPTNLDMTARDNVNIVRFDNGNELPSGVLGISTSYFSGCLSSTVGLNWYVTETDLTIDDISNWNFSNSAPSSSTFDFQSVAIHELGHSAQLGHINSNSPMFFTLPRGIANNMPSSNEIDGAAEVQTFSVTNPACNQPIPNASNSACSAIPVPVELLQFSGYAKENENILEWSTASEENVSHFVIERSIDGKQAVEMLGKQQAVGFSLETQHYQYADQQPLPVGYYRIRSVDYDGTEEPFNWIFIENKPTSNNLQVSPVPFTNELMVEMNSARNEQAQIEIWTMDGKQVLSEQAMIEAGDNKIALQVDHLKSGIYLLRLVVNNKVQQVKLVK